MDDTAPDCVLGPASSHETNVRECIDVTEEERPPQARGVLHTIRNLYLGIDIE